MNFIGKEQIKRLVIYFFYDRDGIVNRYVPYLLNDLMKNCSELFVICNGKLTPEGREIFLKMTPNLLVRENKGYDVWAYKTALETYGWEKLQEYDEVILMNHTIMGPVYPFKEMFEEMEKQDLDFWGITKHNKIPFDVMNTGFGYVPEHIQSHFIAIRKPMLCSREFIQYWNGRPEINSYTEAVGKHEAIFTKTFENAGYRWKVYVDQEEWKSFTYYPLMKMPVKMIEEYRCPIFKRRSFFHDDHADLLFDSMGDQGKKLLEYLKNKTEYDVEMIWENILRTCHMSDMRRSMNLNYVLPKSIDINISEKRIALVIHSYFPDLVEYCYQYACSMPAYCDVYVTTDSQNKVRKIESTFEKGPWKSVKVILIENRGRDVSALLVGAAPYLLDYELVCFMHDKKVNQLELGITGFSFSERCFENLLGSQEYVKQMINLFDREPRLGLAFPPPPNHSNYYPTMGLEWGPNFDLTKNLAQELGISVPMAESKEPIAPLGTMFWFRPAAMKPLLDKKWRYADFPKEPNGTDGTLLHAIERIYPFVAQESGYYSAWVLSDDYMRTEWTNLNYMLTDINRALFDKYGTSMHHQVVYRISNDKILPRGVIKAAIKKRVPKPIWAVMRTMYHAFGGKKWLDR